MSLFKCLTKCCCGCARGCGSGSCYVEGPGGGGCGRSDRFACSSLEETAGPPADHRSVFVCIWLYLHHDWPISCLLSVAAVLLFCLQGALQTLLAVWRWWLWPAGVWTRRGRRDQPWPRSETVLVGLNCFCLQTSVLHLTCLFRLRYLLHLQVRSSWSPWISRALETLGPFL